MDNNSTALRLITAEELEGFNDTEIKVMDKLLTSSGIKEHDMAKEIGISKDWFSKIKQQEKVQKLLSQVRSRIFNQKLIGLVEKSFNTMDDLMDSTKEEIKFKAASKILDYNSKQTTNEVSTINIERGII